MNIKRAGYEHGDTLRSTQAYANMHVIILCVILAGLVSMGIMLMDDTSVTDRVENSSNNSELLHFRILPTVKYADRITAKITRQLSPHKASNLAYFAHSLKKSSISFVPYGKFLKNR